MTARKHPRWQPDWAVLPGETIKEALQERGLTQLAAAERLGMHAGEVSELIRGHRALSAEMALRFEELTGIKAEVFARLQADYDVAIARRGYKPRIKSGER